MRRVGPEPGALRLSADLPLARVRPAVAERLVKAAYRVMAVSHVKHIIRSPPVVKAMRPHAGHSALGLSSIRVSHRHSSITAGRAGVLRALAFRCKKRTASCSREALRVVFQKGLHHIASQRERHPQAGAVVSCATYLPVQQRGGVFSGIRFAIIVEVNP